MNRKIKFAVGDYYHIYIRGNNRQKVFLDERDYLRYLLLLYTSNSVGTIHLSDYQTNNLGALFSLKREEPLVAIGAYCQMPNHIHLLVREIREGGISLFMQKLSTAYSMYFNIKHSKTGSLFERPFKAKHIAEDVYLKYLFAYIHLNPVKINDPDGWAGKRLLHSDTAKQFLEYYRYSSYPFYTGRQRMEDGVLNRSEFPDYFSEKGDFGLFVDDWINLDQEAVSLDQSAAVKVTP
ncbi:MAG: transposase [Candidatus Vogelbacteria bacterium]|nr:transposase [Candidatus Vogelbacteria bacterium]